MAGRKKTLADLMSLIQGDDEGGDNSSATPLVSQDQGDVGKSSGRVDGAVQGQPERVEVPPENISGNPSVEAEVSFDEEDLGFGEDLKVVSNPKKRKRDSGKTLSVMEKNFDAGGFIESPLLLGTDEFFRDADLSGQARWIYRSLLRATTIAKKVEPVLGNYHAMEAKFRDSQKDLTDSRYREESLKTKLFEQDKKAEEDAKEINRLVDRDLALMKDLNASLCEAAAAKKKVEELEEKLKLAEGSVKATRQEMAVLKKKNKELAKGAQEAVKLTEEGIKLQVAVLAPDLDLSQVGALKTAEDWKIVDILKP
ncbi:uncharacterized protein LOC130944588 [Arachis stenosperma]|uniref:uncharacterized protein LOC130944588 n=1 Tax=Arachis stenosperma TaxID=217475 RepID=UPI0025AB7820|nr:uncharacterized protein LOC130944588 [Arachis stenosperma]